MSHDDDDCLDRDVYVPAHLRVLGVETRRLQEQLARELANPEVTCHWRGEPLPDVANHAAAIMAKAVSTLAEVFNGPINEEAEHTDGDAAVILRASGRLEQVLNELVDAWRYARDMPVAGGDEYPHQLLVAGTRDVIEQINDILDRLANMIECPEVSLAANEDADDEPIHAMFKARIASPQAFEELADYWNGCPDMPSANSQACQFWRTAGLLALGALLGGTLFGGS